MHCSMADCFTCPYPDCINPEPLRIRTYTEKQKRQINARHREARAKRRELGKCTQCGVILDTNYEFKMCLKCRMRARKYKVDERIKYGLLTKDMLDGVERCQKCGKEPPKPGYKLCERCYNSNLTHLAKTPTHRGRGCQTHFRDFGNVFWEERKSNIRETV